MLRLPEYYIIEPTNFCNYRCLICPNRYFSLEEQGYMTEAIFDKILDEIAECAKVVQLYWMGEPLLHSEIVEMVYKLKQKTKAKVIISTNGSLLSYELSKALVSAGLDELIVSLDAIKSNSVYSQIRAGGNLSHVLNHLSTLLNFKSDVHIILQFIDTIINSKEKQGFIDYCEQIVHCDYSIQCLYSWANQMPELNNCSDNLSPVKGLERQPCADLWNKICIRWNGDIVLCCFDWQGRNCIGNIVRSSLEEIWNCDKLNYYREMHINSKYNKIPICSACDAWATQDEYSRIFHL